jgi:predicted glycosyltransferase involved in capsule biosynthesis
MSKEIFIKIGGYDENFYPAGVHDNDIMLRAKYLDYSFKDVPNITPAIYNNKMILLNILEKLIGQ